jgi:hypothetical protein
MTHHKLPRQPQEPYAQQRQRYLSLPQQHLPPGPRRLINFSGSRIRNSAPFTVDSGPVTVQYSYDCSAAGHASTARLGGRADGR